MNLKFRTLNADEIDVRVAQVKDKGCSLLLYKNARVDMDLLDETVGAMNWQREHSRDNANCAVSIYNAETEEWVSKEDTGTESNTEAEKGLASDSFKRACFNWGIGRELYTAPFIWVTAADANIVDKKVRGRFSVSAIDYDQQRRISKLSIVNEKTGQVVFDWASGKRPVFEPDDAQPIEPPKRATVTTYQAGELICEDCGNPITDFVSKGGKKISASWIASKNLETYGKRLCADCGTRHKNGAS